MKSYKYILLVISVLLVSLTNTYAQIGFDNPMPNPHAVLDMKAIEKGFLIPKMSESQRFALLNTCAPNCPNGLMVYDTTMGDFFYIRTNQWYAISAFITADVANNDPESDSLNLALFSNVGLGKVPDANYKLDVNGNARHRGRTNLKDTLTVYQGITVISKNVSVTNLDVSVPLGNFYAASKLTAKDFSSDISVKNVNGPIPKGGIIMWSGSLASIPTGWALCDGNYGTPDLRERFVVGASSTGSYTVSSAGGINKHTLTVNELPNHTHTGSTNSAGSHSHRYKGDTDVSSIPFACDGSDEPSKSSGRIGGDPEDYAGEAAGDHQHTLTIGNAGSGQSHENRPPYYALAYIMKI
jgi:microcystin-dependent protein